MVVLGSVIKKNDMEIRFLDIFLLLGFTELYFVKG